METDPQLVPSVVSVMVVHEPGDWFDDTLRALAAQDYGNFRTLFLLTARRDDVITELADRIRSVLPTAFVRSIGGNVGFPSAANEVLRLVEGDNGFFLICHDDIAPQPDVVRVLVAELFRSNAGIVGPKLTEWYDTRALQHVGLGLDRFGEVDPIVDQGEHDQEQHDAVRDVFVLPSACLLVRADLFRALGGFDEAISFHGEDVDLCWRAHHTGARVVVVPDARVRHLELLTERRPDLNHRALQSRHRMRAVATLTGGPRLLVRSLQMVVVTLVEVIIGVFSGRFGESMASLRALVGLLPRTGSIIARRRAIRGQRVVHEREVLSLQNRGSARLTSYLRGKETTTYVGAERTVRRWREATFGPPLAWFLVILAIVIGSRSFIRNGVPEVGGFLAFPDSPGDLLERYRSSFDGRAFGSTAAVPTGWAVVALGSVFALFRMSLLMTGSIVILFLAGALGAWRLATVFPVNRARVAGMVVYVGTPLVPGMLSLGDWPGLVWFAALPWMVHLLRRAAGIETADPGAVDIDLVDGVAPVGVRYRVRALAASAVVLALAAAFAPVVIVLWAVVGVLMGLATLIAGGSWRVAVWFIGCTAVAVLASFVLNLPWSLGWSRADLVGPTMSSADGRGLGEVLSLSPTDGQFAVLAVALYLPLIAAVMIARAWRLTWSVRAALLVAGFGSLLVLDARGSLDGWLPAPSLLATPVALGLALGAASIAGGFGSDVLGRGFGWRQPFALLANVAMVIGVVPAVIAIGDGAWNTPHSPLPVTLGSQLPVDASVGDYRVLYIGDPRLLPVPGRELFDGVAYAVTDAGPLDFTDRFTVPDTLADDAVERALDLVAQGATLRAGRLLAPLGIRYVVIPKTDGAISTVEAPLPIADGLTGAFGNQLDLGPLYGPPTFEIYLNRAWLPVGAQLTGASADASRLAGEEELARADLGLAQPSMVGADFGEPAGVNQVSPGVVHLAIPFDERIRLDIDGEAVSPRPGFGVTTAFDVDTSGTGMLSYEPDPNRNWWLATQMILWLTVLVAAAGARSPFGRRRGTVVYDETLIDLDDDESPVGIAGEALVTLQSDPVFADDLDSFEPLDERVDEPQSLDVGFDDRNPS